MSANDFGLIHGLMALAEHDKSFPMEAAQLAVSCTGVSRHSGLPAWEFLSGMRAYSERFLWRVSIAERQSGVVWTHDQCFGTTDRYFDRKLVDPLPDFRDLFTLYTLHALVVRAWKGHEVRLTTGALDPRCVSNNLFIIAPDSTRPFSHGDQDLALLLVRALRAVPC